MRRRILTVILAITGLLLRVFLNKPLMVLQSGIARVAKGDVLFEGKANFAGVSTTPDYGFHVRMYPWSMEREGYFQLRISAISIPGLLIRPHQVWRGTIHHPKLHDYLLDGVRVESDVELPFQMGGDPEGWRKDVSFAIAEPVEVLDFRE